MKKISIILFLCIIVCNYVFAVPVDRTPRKVIQPNGDTISISLQGDEYGSWYEDDKGNIIALNNNKYWVYGKVREMDVPENNPTVTMSLEGVNSGVYVMRLIIDNQVVETSQLIVK